MLSIGGVQLSARLIVSVTNDVALEHATLEALKSAKVQNPDLPQTILLNKLTTPTMVLMTHTPKSYLNIQNCKKRAVQINRIDLEEIITPSIVYRDGSEWELHIYDYVCTAKSPFVDDAHPEKTLQNYNRLMFDYYSQLGITIQFKEPNNFMVKSRKIGYCDQQFIGDAYIWDTCILQDFPTWVDELYVNPKHLPSNYLTTLKRELGRYVSDAEITSLVRACFERVFSKQLEEGSLTDFEEQIQASCIDKYRSEGWVYNAIR